MASIGQVVTDIYRRRRVRVLEHSRKIGIAGAHPGSFDLRCAAPISTQTKPSICQPWAFYWLTIAGISTMKPPFLAW
ncbi:MAG TPA: hypothetical protein PL061_12335 [Syntrophales bacterium]|nr:hypothetical protein [Syntrophales bacterium]